MQCGPGGEVWDCIRSPTPGVCKSPLQKLLPQMAWLAPSTSGALYPSIQLRASTIKLPSPCQGLECKPDNVQPPTSKRKTHMSTSDTKHQKTNYKTTVKARFELARKQAARYLCQEMGPNGQVSDG